MTRQQKPKLQVTKDYRMFRRSEDNRPVDLKQHKKLYRSMEKYGFLPSFPLSVVQNCTAKIVKDGQHRLTIAEELGLAVYYVVEPNDFDIAEVNGTQKVWTLRDYAEKYAANEVASYQELLEFIDLHGISIGTSVGLLAGTVSWGNVKDAFHDGRFEVKDRQWADAVASIYNRLIALSTEIKNARCLEACMWVCRVDDFDGARLVSGGKKCRDKLVSYSTRDAYLSMLDEIYNHGRSKKVPLKFQAEEAMRSRNICNASKGK